MWLPVLPDVEPGYLARLIPQEVPRTGEKWEDILRDMDRVIMPGVTHWQSPQFHAFFPAGSSYPSIVGDILSAGVGCLGFSWITSPACTELEVVMMDWLGKMLDIPKDFLNCSDGPGGGIIQGSASESTLVGLLAAKARMLRTVLAEHPDWDEGLIKSKMVAYTSDQSNSSVEKAGLLGSMRMRLLATDVTCRLRGATLEQAMKVDRDKGLIPCYVVATLGTTGTCAFDALEELGPICNRAGVWLHVDAAYAGAALICPEHRHLMAGVQCADSFTFNPHKWLLVNYDCSAMWVKDATWLVDSFKVDRIYLEHAHQGIMPDYRHWQIPLGRRFRALKLWLVLRSYGVEGLQEHIRKQVALTLQFQDLVLQDKRFEVVSEAVMAVVCFRIKGDNSLTQRLLHRLTSRRHIYMVSANVLDKLVLRFVVCSRMTSSSDVLFAWAETQSQAGVVLTTADDADLVSAVNGSVAVPIDVLVDADLVSAVKVNGNVAAPREVVHDADLVSAVKVKGNVAAPRDIRDDADLVSAVKVNIAPPRDVLDDADLVSAVKVNGDVAASRDVVDDADLVSAVKVNGDVAASRDVVDDTDLVSAVKVNGHVKVNSN